jgi:aryl-alcohol dehydrogenase-like predicted oxidoreductase
LLGIARNLVDRGSEAVLDYCEKHNIGFIPWYPLAAADLAKPGSLLNDLAAKHRGSPGQIALAWVLKRSPVMLPIPGTSKVKHLEQDVAAANITLSDGEFAALDVAGKAQAVYRRAPIACSSPAAVVMVACHGKTFSSSTRCVSSSRSEQQSPTTSSL